MRLSDAHSSAIKAAARFYKAPPANVAPQPTNADAPDENYDAAEVSSRINSCDDWRSTETTVFVGNLVWETTEADLYNYFAATLPVVSCEVASHADTGRSKGWALVRFERNEHALQAINQYDQQCFMHRQLSVRLDRASIESGNLFRVYVGNLPFEMTDEELQEKFACFDAVDSHVKVTASGRSRGFGIVMFKRPENVHQAITVMDQAIINERTIEVREERDLSLPRWRKPYKQKVGKASRKPPAEPQPPKAKPKARRGAAKGAGHQQGHASIDEAKLPTNYNREPAAAPSGTLFVNNLSWTSTDDDLFQHFCSIGATPISAQVSVGFTHDNQGLFVPHSQGWGRVEFSNIHAATAAITQLNKSELDGRRINVRFNVPPAQDMPMDHPPHNMVQQMQNTHHVQHHHHVMPQQYMHPFMHMPHGYAPVEQSQGLYY